MNDALHFMADPTLDRSFPSGLDQRATYDLEVILSSKPAARNRRRAPLLAASAAAVSATLIVGSFWVAQPPAASAAPVALPILGLQPLQDPATPTPARLNSLARAAKAAPARERPGSLPRLVAEHAGR